MKSLQLCLTALVIVTPLSTHQVAVAQFAWDGDCGFNWADCCNYGTEQNPNWHNNWTIAPNSTTCPNLPGSEDHVYASTTVILAQPYQTWVKSLTVTGTFMLRSELDVTDFVTINGTITEPTTFLIQNGPADSVQMRSEKGTVSISSYATLEFQHDGQIVGGGPGAMLYNDGLIWKTGPPQPTSASVLNIPVENNGTISCWHGTLMLNQGGTSNGVIEAYGEGEVRISGAYVLDGEVRGDGLIRFLGAAVTITGNYHPTTTHVAGWGGIVSFDVDTSLENLTLGNPCTIGGSADLNIEDFLWNGGYSSMVGTGTTTVQDTMLIQHDSFAGGAYSLQRDMDLNGQSILDTNATLNMNNAELRNDGILELRGNTAIGQSGSTPNSAIQNFGTIRRNGGGGQSVVNVAFLNFGDIAVESGDLNFDGQMESSGPITLNAGTTLLLGHQLQTIHPTGSITGEGGVHFYNDFWSGDTTVDSMLGEYNVGATTIQAGTASFDTDGTIAPLKTIGTLNMIQGFGASKLTGNADILITDQLNWSSGEMAGTGMTFVHGPMILTFVGYWVNLNRTLELNVGTIPGAQPPPSTLSIMTLGTLNCKNVTIDSNVYNNGLISPGTPTFPVAQLHLTGGYTQTAAGQLSINKLGPAHDQLLVDGGATLGGTLTVAGFPASGGQSFTILTAAGVNGTFAQVSAPAGMEVIYTATSVILQAAPSPLCPADIAPIGTPNGVVNVDDLLAVINAWGPCPNPSNCPADIAPANGNDIVNVDDLLAIINAWGGCP